MFQKKKKKKKKKEKEEISTRPPALPATRGHCSFNLSLPLSVFVCCPLIMEVLPAARDSVDATGVFLAPEPPQRPGQMVPVRMVDDDDANIMAEQLKQPTRRRW